MRLIRRTLRLGPCGAHRPRAGGLGKAKIAASQAISPSSNPPVRLVTRRSNPLDAKGRGCERIDDRNSEKAARLVSPSGGRGYSDASHGVWPVPRTGLKRGLGEKTSRLSFPGQPVASGKDCAGTRRYRATTLGPTVLDQPGTGERCWKQNETPRSSLSSARLR